MSSSKATNQGRSWFSVDCADYLNRGRESLGLKQKLHYYLQSQNEDSNEYTSFYLVTAPRFLGYSFNPVSFWYLYDETKELKAMILEVNNTFDERRMYFLKKGMETGLNSDDSSDANNAKFTDTWTKDFHVSPFNSRKGSYALNAYDPFFPCLNGNGTINNTITLRSSKQHMKLIARIFSTSSAIDPTTLGILDRVKFVTLWWWVGFVTFPRIVKEAGTLFFRRKLHVWYRPEVLKESIGRQATENERIIGQIFGSFLEHKIRNSNLVQPIRYIPAIPNDPTEGIIHPNKRSCPLAQSAQHPVEFKITTPLFYDRITRYAHLSEFLQSEILINNDKDRTFYISNPDSLLNLFHELKPKESESSSSCISPQTSSMRLQWAFLHWLRNLKGSPVNPGQIDTRQFPLSQLDRFVVQHESAAQVQKYWTTVVKLLLSDIFAFGIPALIDAIFVAVRLLLCYLTVIAVEGLVISLYNGYS
ncbi:MAG: hypothetical protein Q9167_002233 [Letrouitia subvulpina]